MENRVKIEMRDGVADVRMVRVDKMNALDHPMIEALVAAGERLKTEHGLRAVVLSGEGRAFCAGLDMGNFQKAAAGEANATGASNLLATPRGANGANLPQQAVMAWRELPVPVIAAVHGVAFGGGFQLALGPDMRFVAPDARMSLMEIKWGLVPDMAGILLLRGLMRDDVARELTYSGRIFTGEEALALGLATRVCANPREQALAFAAEIATKSPSAVRAAKRLFALPANADATTILTAETVEQAALFGSPNQLESVRSNLEKRPAVFRD